MKDITSIPKEIIAQGVAAGLIEPVKMKHHAIMCDLNKGMNVQQAADKYSISRREIFRLKKKYK